MSFFGIGLGKQREAEQNAAMLTEAQQTALQRAVNEATTDAERKSIIVNKMIEFANENNASAAKTTRRIYIVAGSVCLVLLIGILIYNKRK